MSLPNLPLISAKQLNDNIEQDNLLVLDASIPPVGGGDLPVHRWPAVSIPNARRMDINEVFSDHEARFPHTLLSPEKFQHACQNLGINSAHHIVVYDDLGLFSAARAWWMLKAMGHQNVSVLDGGLPAWLEVGFDTKPATMSASKEEIEQGDFISQYKSSYFCDSQQVLNAINSANALILDARAAERFHGRAPEPRAGVRAGHMPSAISLPYASLLSNRLLHSVPELTKIFKQLNPDHKPIITTCGSGITACILALAANLAGYQDISVYDGSWSEWGSLNELPVTTD